MKALPQVHSCPTKDELLRHLDEVAHGVADVLREIPDEKLFSRGEPEGWSPAKNIKHVSNTNRLMARWIALPGFFLKLLGRPGKPTLRVEDMSATNRPGITNYGVYPPSAPVPPGKKEALIEEFLCSSEALKKAVSKRSEADLDSRKGAWGGMSLRVFALFAMKHSVHHIGVARARIEGRG